jgi:hypothetical protein
MTAVAVVAKMPPYPGGIFVFGTGRRKFLQHVDIFYNRGAEEQRPGQLRGLLGFGASI